MTRRIRFATPHLPLLVAVMALTAAALRSSPHRAANPDRARGRPAEDLWRPAPGAVDRAAARADLGASSR